MSLEAEGGGLPGCASSGPFQLPLAHEAGGSVSSQLQVWGPHVGSLKSARVGAMTPWEPAHSTLQGWVCPWRGTCQTPAHRPRPARHSAGWPQERPWGRWRRAETTLNVTPSKARTNAAQAARPAFTVESGAVRVHPAGPLPEGSNGCWKVVSSRKIHVHTSGKG